MSRGHSRARKERWAENKARVEAESKAMATAQENRRKMVEAMTPEQIIAVRTHLYQANLAMLREQRAQTISVGANGQLTTSNEEGQSESSPAITLTVDRSKTSYEVYPVVEPSKT